MSRLKLALLALGLMLSAVTTGADNRTYYVVPSNSSVNSSSSCHTLGYYVTQKTEYFATNSTFHFFPGEHYLEGGNNITVTEASRIKLTVADQSMCGLSPVKGDVPRINCRGREAGFVFNSVSYLEIRGLSIENCGQKLYTKRGSDHNNTYEDRWCSTVYLVNVTHFRLINSNISHSNGYGILGHGVYGNSSIEGCHLLGNKGKKESAEIYIHGGNIALSYNNSCASGVSHFLVNQTEIKDGFSVSYGAGLDLILGCREGAIHFELNQVNLLNNSGYGRINESSSFAVQILAFPDQANSNKVTLNNCRIGHTVLKMGSGMKVSIYINSTKDESPNATQTVLEVSGSQFANNTFHDDWSAVHMWLYDTAEPINNQVGVVFRDTKFENNTLQTDKLQQSSGVGVGIVLFRAGGTDLHSMPQFQTIFTSCTFQNNHIVNHPSVGSGALYVEEHSNIILENCNISDNNCSGITAMHSNLNFRGINSITKNSAVHGGGILLADNTVLFLTENTTLYIKDNNASVAGGGIYAEYGTTTAIPLCFFQFHTSTLLNDSKLETINVTLQNNDAPTGRALYGGHIDSCYFLVHNVPWINKHLLVEKSGRIFNETFKYNVTDPTAISSDAVRVCFCENETALCNQTKLSRNKSPGESFSVNVMVVGQRQGKTPGIILAQFFGYKHDTIHLGGNEQTAKVKPSCVALNYTVYSKKENFTANLSLNVPESTYTVGYSVVELNITRCPLGFVLDSYTCTCISKLQNLSIICSSKEHTIKRPSGLWIGYNTPNNSKINASQSGDIIVHHCPLLYCKPTATDIKAYQNDIDQDSQCYLKRRGLLCGQCQLGHSVVFGTPRCIDCSNYTWYDTLGITCGFCLAGVLLVVFLIGFNFTVTEGTINGFILYANIVEACQNTYFPLRSSSVQDHPLYVFLRAFIAWLNLDLGVQACFYNGMTTFEKTAFQFVFPIYIWLITGLLIWLSRNSTLVTRLLQNNGTKVLATLILLSYAKLIRAIAICLVGARLGSELVWFYDASEPYLNGKHMLLFITAIFFIVVLLPYTLALLFIKHLPRLTSLRMFHWLNKFKPLFDAYTGPYKDEYRFWVGLQLLVRMSILVSVSLKANNTLLLLLVIGACSLLLSANYFYGRRIYKKRSVNVIEALLLLNLIFWSIMSIYTQGNIHHHVYPFVGLTFLQFWAVIVYFHVCKPVYYVSPRGRILQNLFQCGQAIKQRIKDVVMCRCARRRSERACLLENSVQHTRDSYDELSEPM